MAAEPQAQPYTRGFHLVDAAVLAALIAIIYGMVAVAREWAGQMRPVAVIHLQVRYLPLYTLFSLTRGLIAYAISFLFTICYGYAAARIRGADRLLVPALDILQSIPVLGFLPGFVLGLVHLLPHRNLGLEIASVLMIFTGQVWNMTFSFYASLKSVPDDLNSVAHLAKLRWSQRFFKLDLPYAAGGLVWNSMMSMAGGWFFLTVSEAFVLGKRDFRLPGLGSYMSLAIEKGNTQAQVLGVLAMIGMIVFLDQIVWRPVVAWSNKFSSEETESRHGGESWLWNWIGRSRLWNTGAQWARRLRPKPGPAESAGALRRRTQGKRIRFLGRTLKTGLLGLLALAVAYAGFRYFRLLRGLSPGDWGLIWQSALATFLRVLAAVGLASLWTIPVGVWIGRNPRWSQVCQPIIQMVASFPAPMIYPVAVGIILGLGGNLAGGSVFLLLLGTQWYILFNVIAGASNLPRELWEVADLAQISWRERWINLILPAIFPALLTGWISAMGGAWNASIVAEYMAYKGKILTTVGLGALINVATDQGRFALLAACVGVMSLAVVGFNRTVWRPLSHMAQQRFKLES